MSDLNLTNTLTAGTPENVNDVQQNFTDVVTWANGNIDSDNFTATTNAILGLSETGTVRRGKSIIATSESTSSTTYTTLTTPDRVQNVVLPTDGLMYVAYQATWSESVNAAARASIFIGANQLKIAAVGSASPVVTEASHPSTGGTDGILSSWVGGLIGVAGTDATVYLGDVTTGQVVGSLQGGSTFAGATTIFAAAGTYTVSIQYKASSGSVTAKNRKLWVWTDGFG